MENKYSTDYGQENKKIDSQKSKSFYFFLGFVIISSLIAFIIGGYILGKEETNNQNAQTEEKEQIKLTAKDIPNNPDEWKTYLLPTLNMKIKLPENLTKNGDWKEQVISASEGSIICFSNKISEVAICSGEIIFAGGTSIDFIESRGGTFTDLQGFTKENNKYYIRTTGNNKFELKNIKFKEIKNPNGIEIIKILGENQISEGSEFPTGGTPGKGYLGAIINTKNTKYPGLSIQLKLDSDISEFEFDQILENIKFTN